MKEILKVLAIGFGIAWVVGGVYDLIRGLVTWDDSKMGMGLISLLIAFGVFYWYKYGREKKDEEV